jgi:hypothetical protein
MAARVYVGGLNENITERELEEEVIYGEGFETAWLFLGMQIADLRVLSCSLSGSAR